SRGFALQAADQLVEPKLLQRVADLVQLARAQLDQGLALAHQLEGLLEAGLARVQAADDLFHARRGGLVGERLLGLPVRVAHRLCPAHRSGTRAGMVPSAKRSRSSSAARAWAALAIGCPCSDCTSA